MLKSPKYNTYSKYLWRIYLDWKLVFRKSKVFCCGQAKEVEYQQRNMFGCVYGSFPFKYLGVPIHFCKLKNSERKPAEDGFEKKK
jgi:hypothetical protein